MFARKRSGQAIIYGVMVMFVVVILFAAISPMIQDQITQTASALTGLSAEGVGLILPFMVIFLIFLPLIILFSGG